MPKIFIQSTIIVVSAVVGYAASFIGEFPEMRGVLTILDTARSQNVYLELAQGKGDYLVKYFPNNSCPSEKNGCLDTPGMDYTLAVQLVNADGRSEKFEICEHISNESPLDCENNSWNMVSENSEYFINRGIFSLIRINGSSILRGAVLYKKPKEKKTNGFVVGLPYRLSVQKKGYFNSLPLKVNSTH